MSQSRAGPTARRAAIVPSNVRQIRILRGPAAAFLEGSANGAIYVETKSGPGGVLTDPQL